MVFTSFTYIRIESLHVGFAEERPLALQPLLFGTLDHLGVIDGSRLRQGEELVFGVHVGHVADRAIRSARD